MFPYALSIPIEYRGRGENVLLELGLAEGRGVGRDEDELGLAAAEGLQGAAVTKNDLARLDDEGKLLLVSARGLHAVYCHQERTLAPIDWASDLDFLGAILAVLGFVGRREVEKWLLGVMSLSLAEGSVEGEAGSRVRNLSWSLDSHQRVP